MLFPLIFAMANVPLLPFQRESRVGLERLPCPSPIVTLFVSQGCHHKLPPTWELKAIDVCSATVLEARSLTSRSQQGDAPSETSRGGSFLASSQLWCCRQSSMLLGLETHHSSLSLHHHVAFSLCCVSTFSSSMRISVIRLVPSLTEYDLIELNMITCANTLFPKMSFSQVLGMRA